MLSRVNYPDPANIARANECDGKRGKKRGGGEPAGLRGSAEAGPRPQAAPQTTHDKQVTLLR